MSKTVYEVKVTIRIDVNPASPQSVAQAARVIEMLSENTLPQDIDESVRERITIEASQPRIYNKKS